MSKKGKNPFTITFGKKPVEYIYRPMQIDEILNMFTEDPITNQVYIIRGPRGTGKTVLLADIANRLEADSNWIVIRCAPTSDIIGNVAEGLEHALSKTSIDVDASISLPVFGGVHLQKAESPSSDTYRIVEALRKLEKKGKKLLVTVDEITNTPQMRDFASNLQIWMGQDFPVFFLGTALFERIEELQNVANLTFLYRAPKIDLTPLDMVSIEQAYRKALDVSEERGRELAKLTRGYSFAFQALGYIYWNAMPVSQIEDILPDYDSMLSSSSYSKIWQELSPGDRELCGAIARCKSSNVQDIKRELGEDDSNRFNQRRIRLKNRGLVDVSQRGRIVFSLPRFREFALSAMELYGL